MGKTQIYIAILATSAVLAVGCGGNGGGADNGSSNSGAYSSGSGSSSAAVKKTVAVTTKKNAKLGTILAGADVRTLYMFEADTNGSRSACSGACATAWPPLTTDGKPTAGGAASASLLSTFKRGDGTTQVAYAGHPLYYYAPDKDAGDVYGQGIKGFGARWYVVAPSGDKVQ